MPVFEITAPDGKKLRITAPEGATKEDALAKAQEMYAGSDPRGDLGRVQGEMPVDPSEGGGELRPFGVSTGIKTPETVDRVLAGAGKFYADVGRGAEQRVRQVVPGESDEERELTRTIELSREEDRPLMETTAGQAGNIGAAVATTLPLGPMMNTVGGAAKFGGFYGALQPTVGDESALVNTGVGALSGGLASGAVKGAGALLGLPSRAIEPITGAGQRKIVGRALRGAAGDEVDDIIRALRGAGELVPGSQPTVGQVAGSGGLAAMERAASTVNPQAYTQRMLQQNAARIQALDKVAQDAAARQAATQARRAATQPLLSRVSQSKAVVDPSRVANLIDGIKAKNPARKQLISALDDVKSTLDFTDPQSLKSASQNIGDMINAKGPTGAKINEAITRELVTVKKMLDRQIAKAEPAYGQYLQQYRQLSQPINQMDTLQEIVKRSTTPTVDAMGNPTVTPRALAQALRRGDQIARKATGFKRAQLDKMLTPEQLSALRGVSADLSRAQQAQNLGRGPGSNTVQNLSMANIMGSKSGVGPPTLLSRPAMIANYLRRVFYDKADQDMAGLIQQATLDPRMAAELMEAAAPTLASRAISPIGSALRSGAAMGGAIAPFQSQ